MAAVTNFTDFGAPKYKVCHCLQFPIYLLEKEMATHSWEIPWTEEPGGLPSMGSHRVGHD